MRNIVYNALGVIISDITTPDLTPEPVTVDAARIFRVLTANAAGQNVLTAQPALPGANAINLAADTTYRFEGQFIITRAAGTVSHTTGISFGGTATLASIAYSALAKTSTGATLTAMSGHHGTSAANLVVTAASIVATESLLITVSGVVRASAVGTFIPQFQYSAAPGGAPTILAGSFFELFALGNGSVAAQGG